jgi:hypothetical protein
VADQDPALSAESALTARLQYLGNVSDRLTATMNSADRFVNFAGIIAAATVTAGILGKEPLIAVLAPYALIIIFAYQVQLYTDAERYTVLLEYLEAQLNDSTRQSIFRTTSVLDRAYRKRLSTSIMQVVYGIVLLASLVVSAIKAYLTYGLPWLVADLVGVISLGSLLLGAALRELFQAQEQVEANLSSPVDPHDATRPVEQPVHTHPASP